MKPGTQGFVGGRLREAREARGITAAAMADVLGVTRAAISQYEHDHKSPGPDVMQRISNITRLPERFFVEPIVSDNLERTFYYRSQSAATKGARIRSERKLDWLIRIVDWLETYVAFPVPNLPILKQVPSAIDIRDDDIERAATEARRHWGLSDGPISNVTWLLENHGIIVTRFSLHAEALDSFSERHASGRSFVVLSSDRESAFRSRFDAAHELGHLLLHGAIPTKDVWKPVEHKLMEAQAHRFASSFLLPAESFAQTALSMTLEGLKSLKRQWGVSMQAIVMRLHHLDLIDEDAKVRFFRAFNARGWRKREPLDDVSDAEHPELLRQAIEALVSHRLVKTSDILSSLPYDAKDIEELCVLPTGSFQIERRQIPNAEEIARPNILGDVIPFRQRR
jgi:Zn-dependent peptidase ImmA (M78 family)/DNA-binding XRE family transcriptional regulator